MHRHRLLLESSSQHSLYIVPGPVFSKQMNHSSPSPTNCEWKHRDAYRCEEFALNARKTDSNMESTDRNKERAAMTLPGFIRSIVSRERKDEPATATAVKWTGFHADYANPEKAACHASRARAVCMAHCFGWMRIDGCHIDLFVPKVNDPSHVAEELFPGTAVRIDEPTCRMDELEHTCGQAACMSDRPAYHSAAH